MLETDWAVLNLSMFNTEEEVYHACWENMDLAWWWPKAD